MVVNTKENLPITIKQIPRKQVSFLSDSFLDYITEKKTHNGIKRKKYWIINTDALPIVSFHQENIKELRLFLKLREIAENLGFQMLMILN